MIAMKRRLHATSLSLNTWTQFSSSSGYDNIANLLEITHHSPRNPPRHPLCTASNYCSPSNLPRSILILLISNLYPLFSSSALQNPSKTLLSAPRNDMLSSASVLAIKSSRGWWELRHERLAKWIVKGLSIDVQTQCINYGIILV